MSLLHAAILGLVEGITEYLPISSTGHLILVAAMLGLDAPEVKDSVDAFNIVIQGGAILAVLGLYWPRVVAMLRGLAGRDAAGLRLAVNIVVAFLPAAVLGVLLDDYIDEHLFHPVPVVAALALGGVWMIGIDVWYKRRNGGPSEAGMATRSARPCQPPLEPDVPGAPGTIESLTILQALGIGLFQCVAMWPGTSRSMMTIAGGVLLGLRPRDAAEFSFLLGVPTLGAACAYKLTKNLLADGPNLFETLGAGPVLIGFAVAAVSAAFAVQWLVRFLGRHGLAPFGWYRIALALVLGALAWSGAIRLAS